MRMSRFKFFLAALLALSVPAVAQEANPSYEKLKKHAGKVMEMPDGNRLVIYLPLEQIWQVAPSGSVQDAARVSMQSGSEAILYWRNSEAEDVDLAALGDVTFLDETPPIVSALDRIVGQRLAAPVGDLPVGAELRSGGRVYAGDETIGQWHVFGQTVRFQPWPIQGRSMPIDPADLVDALGE